MQPTLVLNSMFELWNSNPDAFNALPELDFIPPIAAKLKQKGCSCGMSNEINAATAAFNAIVSRLDAGQVQRFKEVVGKDPLIFGIQTPTGFSTVTY